MNNEWRFEAAVLGTYEIENASWDYLLGLDELNFKYIDTSICYNNDYLLRHLLKKCPNTKLISKIPPQMINEYELMMSNHLESLGRDKIDIMLIHNGRSSWEDLAVKLNSDERVLEVGVSNFSIKQINEYKKKVGVYPKYNEMEINPNYYDEDLIRFCNNNGIKIIAYAILGGKYNARVNIAKYTLPYLLRFAGLNAELVILRSDSSHRLLKSKKFLDDQLGVYLDKGLDLSGIKSSINKSIVPTSYSFPKYYSFVNKNGIPTPTNGDQIYMYRNQSLCTSFTPYTKDEIGLLDYIGEDIPNYEFITDYRVYYRYMLNEFMKSKGYKLDHSSDHYGFPSTYTVEYYKKYGFLNYKRTYSRIELSVNLLTESGLPSKINTGKELLSISTSEVTL